MSERRFSIQKHEAVDFHYVLRLEIDGEPINWAVPRGPSPDPRVKRLAFRIEDASDLNFEGVIPEGEYKGKVIVWDSGTWSTFQLDGEKMSAREQIGNGKFDFWLEGQKLSGGFTLLRIEEGDGRWLLMKMTDEKATSMRNPVVTEPLSVISGKKIEEIDD